MKKLIFSSILLISVSVNAEVGGVTASSGNKPKAIVPISGGLTGLTTEQQHALKSAQNMFDKCLDDVATKYGYIKEKQASESADNVYFALSESNVPKGELTKVLDEISAINKPLRKQIQDYREQLKKVVKESEKKDLVAKIKALGKKIHDTWNTKMAEFRKKYKLEEAYQKALETQRAYVAKEKSHLSEELSCLKDYDKVVDAVEPNLK